MKEALESAGAPCFELVAQQLVGPEHRQFKRTRYRDSPATLCPRAIALARPCLTHAQMARLRLLTTSVLSLFGIYVDRTSGLIIVYCRNRESYAIRRDPYELQDVMNRTGSWGLWVSGEAKCGVHYVAADGAGGAVDGAVDGAGGSVDDIKRKLAAHKRIGWETLSAEISRIEKRYSIKVPVEVEFGESRPQMGPVIPLLPIYVGWPKRIPLGAGCDLRCVAHVDYSAPDFRAQMNAHQRSLQLYQVIYSAVERLPYKVELSDPEWRAAPIDKALDAFVHSRSRALAEFVHDWYAHTHVDDNGGAAKSAGRAGSAGCAERAHSAESAGSANNTSSDELDQFYQAIEAEDREKRLEATVASQKSQKKTPKRKYTDHSEAETAHTKKAHLQGGGQRKSSGQRKSADEDTALDAFYSVLV